MDPQVLMIIGGTAAGVTFTMKMVDYITNQVARRRNGHHVNGNDGLRWPAGTAPAQRELETTVAVLKEHMSGIDAAVVVAVNNVERQIGDFKDQHSRDLNDIKIRLGRIEAKTP